MECLCTLTLIVALSIDNVAIKDVYGLPLHCVQGTFHYEPQKDALVFRRTRGLIEERVTIKLPHPNIRGQFQVAYCWGQSTGKVGTQEVGVEIQRIEKGLA